MPEGDVSAVYSIGTVLRKMGAASRDDIAEALRRQAGERTRLGEILVTAGRLSREDLTRALEAQRMLRSRNRRIRALGAALLSELSSKGLDHLIGEAETLSRAGAR